MPIVFKITGSNITNGDLEIDNSYHQHHRLPSDVDEVRWEIENDAIDSITSIKLKRGTDNIWEIRPHPVNSDKKIWKGKIDPDAGNGDASVFSITWYKAGVKYDFDPIISIKPRPQLGLLSLIIPAILGVLVIVQTLRLRNFRQQKNSK